MTPTQALQAAREALNEFLCYELRKADMERGKKAIALVDSALASGEPATTAGDEVDALIEQCALDIMHPEWEGNILATSKLCKRLRAFATALNAHRAARPEDKP